MCRDRDLPRNTVGLGAGMPVPGAKSGLGLALMGALTDTISVEQEAGHTSVVMPQLVARQPLLGYSVVEPRTQRGRFSARCQASATLLSNRPATA